MAGDDLLALRPPPHRDGPHEMLKIPHLTWRPRAPTWQRFARRAPRRRRARLCKENLLRPLRLPYLQARESIPKLERRHRVRSTGGGVGRVVHHRGRRVAGPSPARHGDDQRSRVSRPGRRRIGTLLLRDRRRGPLSRAVQGEAGCLLTYRVATAKLGCTPLLSDRVQPRYKSGPPPVRGGPAGRVPSRHPKGVADRVVGGAPSHGARSGRRAARREPILQTKKGGRGRLRPLGRPVASAPRQDKKGSHEQERVGPQNNHPPVERHHARDRGQ